MIDLAFTANSLLVTLALVSIIWLTNKTANRIFVSWNQATLA